MTVHEQTIEAAMRALMGSCPLRIALEHVWEIAYREGDLDRQRMERAVIKPKRAARGKR